MRRPLDEARKDLLISGISEALLDQACEEYRRLTKNRRWLTPPPMLVEERSDDRNWYPGADRISGARFWPVLKKVLLDQKGWSPEAVDSVHQASDKIVAWLEAPSAASIRTRGLVIGYVQSGKTANFTAVMAKAADVEYRFFIVLSGTKTNLRQQTYDRLDVELVQLNSGNWFNLLNDRNFDALGNADYFLRSAGKDQRVLCVVKKNSVVLRKLLTWLRSASPELLRQTPFLVIDDEADEASINTTRNQADADSESVYRTTINRQLVELLTTLPKAAYVGYTATPFANVFINPNSLQDLYPRDFIVTLPKPADHFSPERIFGRDRLLDDETDEEYRGIDMVRIVPDNEVSLLRPPARSAVDFSPQITSSLQEALQYFWLAFAARVARGQGQKHATMLVHTSQKVAVHAAMTDRLRQFRQTIQSQLNGSGREALLARWRAQWEEEQSRVDAAIFDQQPVAFAALLPYLDDVVARTREVTDNSQSLDRLSYEGSEARIQVAVGGNTLSRGLTLEGLLVSFFVRAAGAYDTLLQMGRWFGYRPGYGDLTRIWMTGELEGQFRDLAIVEEELRRDIERYALEGITPLQYGPRVRAHPDLNITAPLKMQFAVRAEVSYGGERGGVRQTVLFEHLDRGWLETNIAATDRFVEQLIAKLGQPTELRSHKVFYTVPAPMITAFLERYQFHPAARDMSSALLQGYIRDQNSNGALQQWNVVLRGVRGNKASRANMQLGGLDVPLLERARRATPATYANIGSLMSRGDIGADLPEDVAPKNADNEALHQARREFMPQIGTLLIYPLNRDSQPAAKETAKVALGAAAHVMALGFVFPRAAGNRLGAQEYFTVDPSLLDQGEFELDEEDAET